MGSKPPDMTPDNPASLKRARFDVTKSTTMVYVRRKIDHDQPNKSSPSSEPPKDGCQSAKEPNLGVAEANKEPNLEQHETNLETDLNELKGPTGNPTENKEIESASNAKGDQIESQPDSELSKIKAGPSTVCPPGVAMETKLEPLHELEPVPIKVPNGEKETNLSPNEAKSEPDLVCHETNFDADLAEVNITASNQISSLGVNENKTEHHLDADTQQQKILVPNQVANGHKDQSLGENEPKLGPITPKLTMTDANDRSSERENFRERFAKLQAYLKDCDRSRQDDYFRTLRSLSPDDRSKHALELERRAMDLLMEEGKELRRMNNLHILGKDWLKDKVSVLAQTNFRRQL